MSSLPLTYVNVTYRALHTGSLIPSTNTFKTPLALHVRGHLGCKQLTLAPILSPLSAMPTGFYESLDSEQRSFSD